MQYTLNNKPYKFTLLDTIYPKSSFEPMKKTTFLSFLISFTLLFSSCGKETQSTTQGGGKLVIKLTSIPANNNEAILVQSLFSSGTTVRYYYPTKNNSGIVLTDTFNVTTGQNFPINIFGGSTSGCAKIYVESYLDGKLYKTKTFSVGGAPITLWGGTSATCDYASSQLSTISVGGIPYNITID